MSEMFEPRLRICLGYQVCSQSGLSLLRRLQKGTHHLDKNKTSFPPSDSRRLTSSSRSLHRQPSGCVHLKPVDDLVGGAYELAFWDP